MRTTLKVTINPAVVTKLMSHYVKTISILTSCWGYCTEVAYEQRLLLLLKSSRHLSIPVCIVPLKNEKFGQHTGQISVDVLIKKWKRQWTGRTSWKGRHCQRVGCLELHGIELWRRSAFSLENQKGSWCTLPVTDSDGAWVMLKCYILGFHGNHMCIFCFAYRTHTS